MVGVRACVTCGRTWLGSLTRLPLDWAFTKWHRQIIFCRRLVAAKPADFELVEIFFLTKIQFLTCLLMSDQTYFLYEYIILWILQK